MKTPPTYHLELEQMYHAFQQLKDLRDNLEPTTDLSTYLASIGLEYERNKMHRKLEALMDRISYDVLPHIEKDKITVD